MLAKETLTELSPDMLETVVGASALCIAGETFKCTLDNVNCFNDISFEACPTVGFEECLRSEICVHTVG